MIRTWRVHELGEPTAVMRLEQAEAPTPTAGQVAIDVEATGLAFPDVLQCRGEYQVKPPLPFTVGGEVAGLVAGVGEGVTGFAVGDRVCALAVAPGGGLTERVAVAAMLAFPVPDGLSAAKAASLPMNYQTTWFALHRRAALQPGETLLVHAAAGGVGSAAVQLGQAAGARVLATAGGPEKCEVVRGLGADLVIDYRAGDFVDAVKQATDGRGADVIYDPVGGDVFDRSRKCIAWDGRLLVIGFTSGRIPEVPANHVLLKNYAVVGVHWGASIVRDPASLASTHDELVRLFDAGDVDPLVFREIPFEEAPQALELLAGRGTWGKVVVSPSG